jgi:pimeloyl-ACP methyl ester carboxylesterase
VTGYDDAFLATGDGPRIHYRTYPAAGAQSGPAVICLHGLTRNERDFEDLAPRIAALGRQVIVPSQRGRGLSDRDRAERYNAQVYASDMLALLDHLGIDKAVFVGTSMGGGITMVTAALAPQRLAGAVLNDVCPEIDPVGLARIRGFVGAGNNAASWQEAAARCRDINGTAFPEETGEAFWLSFARKILREEAPGCIVFDYDPAISASLGNVSDPPPNLWPLFDALNPIPTLVIRGEITDVLMPSTVDEMRRRKPDLRLVSLPGVGHAPFMTEPAAWTGLSEFIMAIQ